jgi:SAM-dependent methyltransferase
MSGINMEVGALKNTGERMVPESAESDVFWEHIYRYVFARQFVRAKRVLDIACGEGYGTRGLLAAGAASVIGVDISQEACDHAREKYHIDARCGSATDIPVEQSSVDVVVSFETLEHIVDQEAFVQECVRGLCPSGMLVISTPNRDVYRENCQSNPFHCRELSEPEFITLLAPRFRSVRLYSQSPKRAYPWSFRSLLAARSPWRHLRGYYWLRHAIGRSAQYNRSEQTARNQPDEAISRKDGMLSSIVNPYKVRRRSRISGEKPAYLIAVCEGPRSTG